MGTGTMIMSPSMNRRVFRLLWLFAGTQVLIVWQVEGKLLMQNTSYLFFIDFLGEQAAQADLIKYWICLSWVGSLKSCWYILESYLRQPKSLIIANTAVPKSRGKVLWVAECCWCDKWKGGNSGIEASENKGIIGFIMYAVLMWTHLPRIHRVKQLDGAK